MKSLRLCLFVLALTTFASAADGEAMAASLDAVSGAWKDSGNGSVQ